MIFLAAMDSSIITLLILTMLFTLSALVCIFLEKKGNKTLKVMLFAIIFGLFLYHLVPALVITGLIKEFPFLLRGVAPIYYIVQPAVYFYVILNLNENYKFEKIDLLHLFPVCYAIIDNWGFYINGPKHWQYWSNLVASNYVEIVNYPGSLVKAKFNFVLRLLLYISYTLFAWRYFIKMIQMNPEIKNQVVLRWLKIFLFIISFFVLSLIFSSIYNSNFILGINSRVIIFLKLPLFISGLSIITLAIYILLNPILLYGLPKINSEKSDVENEIQSLKTENKIEKEIIIVDEFIDNNELELANSLILKIKNKQLYKNVDFSLTIAADHLSIPGHHISYLINKYINKSFPDIVCEMRIENAIQLLNEKSNVKYTMEAIGTLSGFNSRTTFYVSFKKMTGMSPNEYLKKIKTS